MDGTGQRGNPQIHQLTIECVCVCACVCVYVCVYVLCMYIFVYRYFTLYFSTLFYACIDVYYAQCITV